jgi:hypothetical protein
VVDAGRPRVHPPRCRPERGRRGHVADLGAARPRLVAGGRGPGAPRRQRRSVRSRPPARARTGLPLGGRGHSGAQRRLATRGGRPARRPRHGAAGCRRHDQPAAQPHRPCHRLHHEPHPEHHRAWSRTPVRVRTLRHAAVAGRALLRRRRPVGCDPRRQRRPRPAGRAPAGARLRRGRGRHPASHAQARTDRTDARLRSGENHPVNLRAPQRREREVPLTRTAHARRHRTRRR